MAARGPRYEATQNGEKYYMLASPCKRGHLALREVSSGSCTLCKRMLEGLRVAANREAYNARKARERMPKLEELAAWARLERATEPPEKRAARLQRAKEKARDWRRTNPKHHLALTNAHKARIKQCTPPWADRNKIVEVYKKCPPGYQVDHIIPLRGQLVSGLHVHENLQYLPPKENRAKSNKFEVAQNG
jgi:hypothetical protein